MIFDITSPQFTSIFHLMSKRQRCFSDQTGFDLIYLFNGTYILDK